MLGETTPEVKNVEVLMNLFVGLLAGDLGLWSLVSIVALVVWVVVDAAILARGMPKGSGCDNGCSCCHRCDKGGLWGNGIDENDMSRLV